MISRENYKLRSFANKEDNAILRRVVIQDVWPEINEGQFPAKKVVGESVAVEASLFADGHHELKGVLLYRKADHDAWQETPLAFSGNDRWQAQFTVEEMGFYEYTLKAWVVSDPRRVTSYAKTLLVEVSRKKAGFSAWYEMFPRSSSPVQDRSGTFKDCENKLDDIAAMGFDVLYFPPIHPLGLTHRKGKNNSLEASPSDPGSPWAIGSPEGGHMSIHPALGTEQDLISLIHKANRHNIEIALDLAFQCSPDHPYVRSHPEWFTKRPDGGIQYAENPPKKYEDIYPLNFFTPQWRSLWAELLSVVEHWVNLGIRIFRIDNPHTKPFVFWEWLISRVKQKNPEVIFLSEAFTRPKIMYHLAKLGFDQSYTYFTWRNTKEELTDYFKELTQAPIKDFFRPNLFTNTPDILHAYLQTGGRPAFMIRLILAATLGANYGIYGPPFEFCEARAVKTDSEEYADSEKYEIRHWENDRPHSLKSLIALVNRIRHENQPLQSNANLIFHRTDNPQIICYSKNSPDASLIILVVVDLDPHFPQSGWVELDLDALSLGANEEYAVYDLLSEEGYLWHGARNYVALNPHRMPAHIFRVERLHRMNGTTAGS